MVRSRQQQTVAAAVAVLFLAAVFALCLAGCAENTPVVVPPAEAEAAGLLQPDGTFLLTEEVRAKLSAKYQTRVLDAHLDANGFLVVLLESPEEEALRAAWKKAAEGAQGSEGIVGVIGAVGGALVTGLSVYANARLRRKRLTDIGLGLQEPLTPEDSLAALMEKIRSLEQELADARAAAAQPVPVTITPTSSGTVVIAPQQPTGT